MIGLPGTQADYYVLAQFAILASGLSYAFATTYGRRFKRLGVHPIVLAGAQAIAASLVMIPIALSVDGMPSFNTISLSSILALLGLGVVSTAIAYILFFKILESAGAVNVSLVTLLIPISAILLGVFILQERLEMIHLIGMGLIAIGLSFVDGRLWRSRLKL